MGHRVRGIGSIIPEGLHVDNVRRGEHPSPETIMKILDVPQSGKFGVSVSFRTRYGQSRRPFVPAKDPKTPVQLRMRALLARIAARWRTLTDEQRALWIAIAREVLSRSRTGQSGALTGCQLFTKINFNLAIVGEEQVTEPPPRPRFRKNPVGALTITNTRAKIALKLKVSGTPAQPIIVLGYPPVSGGVSFARDFTILGLLPVPVGGVSDITELYVARYGVPPVGKRLLIRTRQQIDGWEDLPEQTTAIVPAA
jgi:hypothetical protein